VADPDPACAETHLKESRSSSEHPRTQHLCARRCYADGCKAGESVYVDDGRLRTSDVHVDDAATLFLAATEAKAGDVFNGTGSTTVTHGNWPKRSERHLNFQRAQSAAKRRRRDGASS